jgi:hypothetical protein
VHRRSNRCGETHSPAFEEVQMSKLKEFTSAPEGTKVSSALVVPVWQELLKQLPMPARPFFAVAPSNRVEDLAPYIGFVLTSLKRSDFSTVHLIRTHDLADAWLESVKGKRLYPAMIQNALRSAARVVLRDLLRDGVRSDEEINKLADQYAFQAFANAIGMQEVMQIVPGFDPELVYAEAIFLAADRLEWASSRQLRIEQGKEDAIEAYNEVESEIVTEEECRQQEQERENQEFALVKAMQRLHKEKEAEQRAQTATTQK